MRSQRVLTLVEIALTVALCWGLNVLALRLPINVNGGNISFAMLPIFVLGLRRGVLPAMAAGVVFGVLDYFMEPVFVAYAQVLLDYGVAFAAVGLAGLGAPLYRNALASSIRAGVTVALGWMLVGALGRFAAAVVSGAIFFGQYAPAGQPVWIYSIVYNASYIGPSLLLCAVAATVVLPALERAVPVTTGVLPSAS